MSNTKKQKVWFFVSIVTIAALTRFYNLDLDSLLPEQKASVLVSALLGILSVVGLYFLVKELFDEKIALISSFLLATSNWHILVSKLGTKDMFMSFVFIWAFYLIWHGARCGRIFNLFLAGLFGGAGFYAGKSYFAAVVVALLTFWNYWDYIKNDFHHSKYEEAKTQVLQGLSLLVITVIAVVLPVGFYIWRNPDFILLTNNSVFSGAKPLELLYENIRWVADKILFIKFGGGNLISWLVTTFFVLGFIKEFIHWLKRKHGHFSVVHTFIFSWLFVMLIPTLLAKEPSILGLSIVLPPILILSAKGLWWTIEKLNRWKYISYPRPHKHWKNLDAGPLLALTALLVSISLLELF